MVKEITVQELKRRMEKKEDFVLLDVREPDEHSLCCIEGSRHIPMSEFAEKAEKELAPNSSIVIHCHLGGRSLRACQYLEELGFTDVASVKGGIDAWALHIDNKVPRY